MSQAPQANSPDHHQSTSHRPHDKIRFNLATHHVKSSLPSIPSQSPSNLTHLTSSGTSCTNNNSVCSGYQTSVSTESTRPESHGQSATQALFKEPVTLPFRQQRDLPQLDNSKSFVENNQLGQNQNFQSNETLYEHHRPAIKPASFVQQVDRSTPITATTSHESVTRNTDKLPPYPMPVHPLPAVGTSQPVNPSFAATTNTASLFPQNNFQTFTKQQKPLINQNTADNTTVTPSPSPNDPPTPVFASLPTYNRPPTQAPTVNAYASEYAPPAPPSGYMPSVHANNPPVQSFQAEDTSFMSSNALSKSSSLLTASSSPTQPKSNLPISRIDPSQVPNPQKDSSRSGPYPYPSGDVLLVDRIPSEAEYFHYSVNPLLQSSIGCVPEYSSFIEHSKIPWIISLNMMGSGCNDLTTESIANSPPVVLNTETSISSSNMTEKINDVKPRNVGPPRCERCRSYFCAYSGMADHFQWKCNFCGMSRNKLPTHFQHDMRGLSQPGMVRDPQSDFVRSYLCSPTVEYVVDDIESYSAQHQSLEIATNALTELGVGEKQSTATQVMKTSPHNPMHFLFCIELPQSSDPIARSNFDRFLHTLSVTITSMAEIHYEASVSFLTYSSAVHFYDFYPLTTPDGVGESPRQIRMGDVQNPFVPLPFTTRSWLSLKKDLPIIQQFLSILMEYALRPENTTTPQDIPAAPKATMGAAVRCAQLILSQNGGHVIVTSINGCNHGIGMIKPREENTLMTKVDEKGMLSAGSNAATWWKDVSTESARRNISFDVLFLNDKAKFLEVSTLAQIAHFTSGRVLNLHKLIPGIATNVSHENLTPLRRQLEALYCRPLGNSGILRARVSRGTRVKGYTGHFLSQQRQEIDIPLLSPHVSYNVEIEHEGSSIDVKTDAIPDVTSLCAPSPAAEERTQNNSRGYWYFQSALLYTTADGSRRLRIASLRLPITNQYATFFRGMNLQCTLSGFAHHALNDLSNNGVTRAKDALLDRAAQLLFCYRRQCSSSQHTGQLILPESLKLLPLYLYALLKSRAFRPGNSNARMDDRAVDLHCLLALPPSERIVYIYPYMTDLTAFAEAESQRGENHFYLPTPAQLCGVCLKGDAVHALHDPSSQALYIYVPRGADGSAWGVRSAGDHGISTGKLPIHVQALVRAIRLQNPSISCVPVCVLQGSGDVNESGLLEKLVEDKSGDVRESYIDFLCQLHATIRELLLIS